MKSETYEKLKCYSKELGLDVATVFISIEDLIDSHRHLRNMHILTNKKLDQIMQDYRNKGYEDGYVNAINREFISLARLKKMNILEFANFLSNNESL
jgi:hypothetical protein